MCCAEILPGILPTLGLKIFLALIPIVLTMSAKIVAALPSESVVDFDVGRKFFLFQFVVVFLFITIIQAMSSGGGDSSSDSSLPIVALAEQLIDDPQQIPTWLGTSIPQVVRFSPLQLSLFAVPSTQGRFLSLRLDALAACGMHCEDHVKAAESSSCYSGS